MKVATADVIMLETIPPIQKKEIPTPKYHCATCTKNKDLRCDVFERRIEPEYNRCFYHSIYDPVPAIFKPLSNDEMQKILEKQSA